MAEKWWEKHQKEDRFNNPFAELQSREGGSRNYFERKFPAVWEMAQIVNGISLKVGEHPAVFKVCNKYGLPQPSTIETITQDDGDEGREAVYFNIYATTGSSGRIRMMTCHLVRTKGGVKFDAYVNSSAFPRNLDSTSRVNFEQILAPDLVRIILDDLGLSRHVRWYELSLSEEAFPAEIGAGFGGGGRGFKEAAGIGSEPMIDLTRFSGIVTADKLAVMFLVRDKNRELNKRHVEISRMLGAVEVDLGVRTFLPRYLIAVCQAGHIAESAIVGNAMLAQAWEKPLEQGTFLKLKGGQMSAQEMQKLLDDRGVLDFMKRSKASNVNHGAARMRHVPWNSSELKTIQAEKIKRLINSDFKDWPGQSPKKR